MKSITTFLSNAYIRFWTTLKNAAFDIIKKTFHTLRGLQSNGLLIIVLMCTLFGLQYLALSTFAGNEQFGVVSALISMLFLFTLDRTLIDSDSWNESRIEHLLGNQPNSSEIDDLKNKRASKMAARVATGITIGFIAATLSMSLFLKPAIEAELAAKEGRPQETFEVVVDKLVL